MEQVEPGFGVQSPQEFSQPWEAPQESQQTPEAPRRSSVSPQDTAEPPMVLHFQPTLPTSPQPSDGVPGQEASVELLLGALDVAARKLASAENAGILPLALQEFLALCGARRGLVLTRSEEVAGCQVAVRQQIPEDVAEEFTRERRFWALPAGGAAFAPSEMGASGPPGDQHTPGALEARLAAVGIPWYAWLPLALPEGVEAVLIALGEGNLPAAGERARLLLAGAVLGDLAAAALQRARLRHLLVRSERVRDEFIGLASHELKSPLTVIKGYSQLLLRQARRSELARTLDLGGLEAISQQVNRMSSLVGELLEFSRIQRGTLEVEPAPVDVVALVRQALAQHQRALPDVIFYLTAREPELIALADRALLTEVLGYLLENAIKFGQEEGVVEVIVQRVLASSLPPSFAMEPATNGQAAAQGEVALISVRDYGPGLPSEERDRLFTAFYRGPEHSPQRRLAGLGLGLYVSHALISRQNGHLWAEFPGNDHAAGSIFYLSLPLAPAF